jgi:hypothetical protein
MHPPTADPKDFESLDGIIHALYEVISGPKGRARDWQRYRSLFAPEARSTLAIVKPGELPRLRFLDTDAYIARVEPIFQSEDFWEVETERKSEVFGNIAHVLSYYESLRTEHGEPFTSGANRMQLFHDGTRWWIVSVMWNTERG